MADPLLRYTLRVNRELFKRFRSIAEYEGRSANKEIEQYIKQRVRTFEKEQGKCPEHEDNDFYAPRPCKKRMFFNQVADRRK